MRSHVEGTPAGAAHRHYGEAVFAPIRSHASTPLRYLIAASIMFVCAALQAGLQAQAEFTEFLPAAPWRFPFGRPVRPPLWSLFRLHRARLGRLSQLLQQYGIDFLPCALFAITAAGVAVVTEIVRAESRRGLEEQQTQRLLLQEAAHRKNTW